MSRAKRADAEFVLTDDERERLLRWSQGGGSVRQAVRAEIVLECAESGVVSERVAAELRVTTMMVGKWRKRFSQARCDGLADGSRPGRRNARRVLTGSERDQLTRWPRRAKTARALELRSKIVLTCADELSNAEVAERLGPTRGR